MGFKVQKKACSTCIYRKDSPLDLKKLEAQVADKYGGFKGHRICHHNYDVCCRGFWNRNKDKFALGQIAQRLNMVEFVWWIRYCAQERGFESAERKRL